jgi:hypothetical protein
MKLRSLNEKYQTCGLFTYLFSLQFLSKLKFRSNKKAHLMVRFSFLSDLDWIDLTSLVHPPKLRFENKNRTKKQKQAMFFSLLYIYS